MFYDATRRIVLILMDVEDGTNLDAIETECEVTVSPAKPAEVIVYLSESHCKVVFEASYGALPDGTVVIAVKNGSGAFPTTDIEPKLKVKILLNPYQVADPVDVIEPRLVLWLGGCPICGKVKPEEIDEFEDDDDGDGPEDDDNGDGDDSPEWEPSGDEGEAPEAPEPPKRRWSLDMLKPSTD